jgi:photosystem II stability/assembly factor-like uncharacterized protein
MTRPVLAALVALVSVLLGANPSGQERPDSLFSAMRWRLVGPNRAGRVWAVAGVPGNPAVYYIGTPAGGLWKSTSGGTTWVPASAGIPVTGIGAVAVAPSRPQTVYVGTGSNTIGDGVYRSDDGGTTWRQAGLRDTKYITALVIDPRHPNADVVLAGAGSGGNFGSMVFYNNDPTPARGVYRTTDGGRTWTQTLFVGDRASVVDVVSDRATPDSVFASFAVPAGVLPAGPPIYRSDDNGVTWTRLLATGLPPDAVSANIAVAPGTRSQRLYALTGGRGSRGLYRSDDGGRTWTLMTSRTASAGVRLYVDPSDPDLVYTMGTSMYRSADGGRTLAAFKGAPGGDDATALWIDPDHPTRMILGADQGPAVSLDSGRTWTPWYTVPNGEHYFVSTDNQFPYWIYAAQQDSGTVAIRSRGASGAIRPTDWHPVSGYEQGHIFADPFDPRFVYSHGDGHTVVRFDRTTGQSVPVYTPAPDDRFGPRPGMELSPADRHWMFVGAQWVMASNDRLSWKRISPDLTARQAAGGRPASGTVVAIAPSALDLDLIWAGTSNGVVQLTRDRGKTWTDVSPPRLFADASLTLWSLEASRRDAGVAYATAIDLSDRRSPCVFRTADFGATWAEAIDGLPAGVPTRVVREDPQQPNLLYAGTQAGVFVSFDRGRRWQPLQLNLPTVPVNDITVHENDLVIATWGRGLWVLDDVSPLRQIDEARSAPGPAFLYQPAAAVRVRSSVNRDTPLPPEVPSGQNPPDGAVIDYVLKEGTAGPFSLSIVDAGGRLVREFTDAPPPLPSAMPNVPEYWFKQPDALATTPGMHRFAWDLRYQPPPSLDYDANGEPSGSTFYGIVAPAIVGQSPRQQPLGPLAVPGVYEVRLTAGGSTITRRLQVGPDPRLALSAAEFAEQASAERALAGGITVLHDAIEQLRRIRRLAAESARSSSLPQVRLSVETVDRAALGAIAALASNRSLVQLLESFSFGDQAPTPSTQAAVSAACARADGALRGYRDVLEKDVAALERVLSDAHLQGVPRPAVIQGGACRIDPERPAF